MVMPFMPFTQEQLDGGVDALIGLFSTLPSGTRMKIGLMPAREIGLESAELTISFLGGIPVSIDGVMNSFEDPCFAEMTFSNVSPLALLGENPSLPVTTSIQDGSDVLAGDITFNGTNTAHVEVSLNGGDTMAFALDLTTGAVTLLATG